MVYPNIDIAKRDYAEFKADVARCGREPEHVRMTQLINTVSAATKAEAEDKWAEIDKLPIEIDALSLLSEALNFDFARKGMDEAFTDDEMAQMSGSAGHSRPRRCAPVGKRIRRCATSSISAAAAGCITQSSAGPRRSPIASSNGSPSVPATVLSIAATHVPATYEDFVRFVIPELQRRGLFRTEFAGKTLAREPRDPCSAGGRLAQRVLRGGGTDNAVTNRG